MRQIRLWIVFAILLVLLGTSNAGIVVPQVSAAPFDEGLPCFSSYAAGNINVGHGSMPREELSVASMRTIINPHTYRQFNLMLPGLEALFADKICASYQIAHGTATLPASPLPAQRVYYGGMGWVTGLTGQARAEIEARIQRLACSPDDTTCLWEAKDQDPIEGVGPGRGFFLSGIFEPECEISWWDVQRLICVTNTGPVWYNETISFQITRYPTSAPRNFLWIWEGHESSSGPDLTRTHNYQWGNRVIRVQIAQRNADNEVIAQGESWVWLRGSKVLLPLVLDNQRLR